MYLIKDDVDNEQIITFELFHAADGEVKMEPLFQVPSVLEPQWFKFNESLEWTVFIRKEDQYLALLEVDIDSEDHTQAAGGNQGKTVQSIDFRKSFVYDFDETQDVFYYISDPERLFV